MADLRGGSSVGGYPVWHYGNMGLGSGLDADTIRGYVPLDLNGGTMTGDIVFDVTSERTMRATGTNVNWGFYFNTLSFGMYDWKNSKEAVIYSPTYKSLGLLTGAPGVAGKVNTPNVVIDDGAGNLSAASLAATNGISGKTLALSATTGAPMTVASSVVVTNLNADKLDGNDSTAFATSTQGTKADNAIPKIASSTDHAIARWSGTGGQTLQDTSTATIDDSGNLVANTLKASVAQGTAPLIVTSTTKVANLNADKLDDMDATNANTASTVVARDASGNFSAGTITANLTGTASKATNVVGGSAGTIPYQSAADTTAMLAAGTAKQALVSNGAAAPSWATLDMSYLPDAVLKKSVKVASTADVGASLQTATTLTGYSASVALNCSTVASSTTVTTTSTAGIKVGAAISGNANIPAGATVSSITNGTTFVISAAATAAGTSVATTFTNTIAALAIDGVTLALNDRVLLKNQTNVGGIAIATANRDNGIYYLSTLGSTSVPWVLTRAADADTTSEIASALVAVDQGTTNGGFLFDNDFKTTDTLGTTAMAWNAVADNGKKLNFFASTTSSELMSVISDETGSGALVFGTGPSLSLPKISTSINDANNKELIKITATSSAVNEITIANAATGGTPSITASGDDANISLNLAGKGTGVVTTATAAAGTSTTQIATTAFVNAEITKDAVVNAGTTPSIQAGADASKPAAGTAGRIYIATDTKLIYRDTGSAWDTVGGQQNVITNGGGTPSITTGADASKGAAGTAGRIYVASDTKKIYRDNGTAWDPIGGEDRSVVRGDSATALVVQVVTADPATPAVGQIWLRSDLA